MSKIAILDISCRDTPYVYLQWTRKEVVGLVGIEKPALDFYCYLVEKNSMWSYIFVF